MKARTTIIYALITLSTATPLLSNITCPAADSLQISDDKTGKVFTIECDISHHEGILAVGGPHNLIGAKTLPFCVAGCAQTNGCILAEWDPVSTHCFLKNAYGVPMRKTGTIAARLEIVPQEVRSSGLVPGTSEMSVVTANGSGQDHVSQSLMTVTAWSTVTLRRVHTVMTDATNSLVAPPLLTRDRSLDVKVATTTSYNSLHSAPSALSTRVLFSLSSSVDALPATVVNPSINGACGPLYGGQTCFQWDSGHCCSPYGVCGSGTGFCLAGCQSAYGECSSASNSTPAASVGTAPLLSSAVSSFITSSEVKPSSSSSVSQHSTFAFDAVAPLPSLSASPAVSDPITSSAVAQSSPLPLTASKPSGKRGLLYNEARFTKNFGGEGSKVTWTSNWNSDRYMIEGGKRVDLGQYNKALEFVPQLWNVTSESAFRSHMDLTKRWTVAAENVGVTEILAFNEANQCGGGGICMTNGTNALVESYLKMMQPHGKTAKLGSPSVTNGPDGIPWLQGFMQECSACQIDFVQAHWYGHDVNDLEEYIQKFHEGFPDKPIWLTEFGLDDLQASVQTQIEFLKSAMDYLDELEFVERYAFFMAKPLGQSRSLVNEDGSLTEVGKVYNSD